MKIRIKRKDTGTIKEFNNKNELFEFVKKNIVDRIYCNNNDEKLKWKILNSSNIKNISIYELIYILRDYKEVK